MTVAKLTSTITYLILEDGTILPGQSFGSQRDIDGEIGKVNTWSIMFLCSLTSSRTNL